MNGEAERADLSPPLSADPALAALIVFGLCGFLMLRYPIIYGGDPIARLANSSRILNGHQLPLLQVLIYGTTRWFYGPKGIFLLMALISAACCAGLYALTREITHDRCAAWLAALVYATHPFILYYSRVPYQEPLLMAGVAWGFYYLFRPASAASRLMSSLSFGAACFARYEGWIAALTAALFEITQTRQREGKTRLLPVVRSLLTFGWAPAAWIIWNRDLSPAGTYVLDLALGWKRLYRPYFIVKSTFWWTESAVVLIALIGFAVSLIEARMRRDGRFPALLGFVVLLFGALVFSGHGIEPDPARLVTEREAFIPICVLIVFSGAGGSRLINVLRERSSNPIMRVGVPLLTLLVLTGYSLDRGLHRIASANLDPELKTDYEVAQFFVRNQASGLVLAAPLPTEPMNSYLHSVEKWSGPAGREKAEHLLKEAGTPPLDYQRILVYSWMPMKRLFTADQLRPLDRAGIESFLRERHIDWLVVFADFHPVMEHERLVMTCVTENQPPCLEIRNANRSARIYAVRSGVCRGTRMPSGGPPESTRSAGETHRPIRREE